MIKLLCKESLLTKKIRSNSGSSIAIIIMFLFVFVFIILPIFAFTLEKQIMRVKATEVRDSIEISAIATYNSIKTTEFSATLLSLDQNKAKSIFTSYLAKNLHLNNDLTPKVTGGIPDGQIEVNSVIIYYSGFPITCPGGNIIKKPTVHVQITIPIKPTLYRYTILGSMGVDTIDCPVHYDTEIVIDR